jgi:ACS family tartrate transporter-like MFS transporter
MDESWQRAVLSKVTWRLLPFLFLLYMVNILDRVNVGFARLQMLDDLGMSETVYALGAGIFYIGYVAFEVPSNLILRRTGARRWIARIMVSWGLITCAMAAVRGPWSFYLLRVLLGFAEAGFFPGIILFLTYWFPTRLRARTVALFMVASPLTGAVGNPVSGAIMQYLDQVGGLRGWQWVFLLEGIPAIVLGFVVLRYLSDRPEEARWLAPAERDWLAGEVGREEKERERHHSLSLLQALGDRRVWLLIVLYFTVAVGSNGFGFYLPKLLQTQFPEAGDFVLGQLASVPNICAVLCMLFNAIHSDRSGERRWHVAVPALLSAVGWGLTAWAFSATFAAPERRLAGAALTLIGLTVAQVGIMCMLPTFWALPTAFLSGVAAAGGIALINSVGNLGGFAGPNVLGLLKDATGDFTSGLLAMACIMCLGSVLALFVRPGPRGPGVKENLTESPA